jgi:predicted amidohydrolase YtcJ
MDQSSKRKDMPPKHLSGFIRIFWLICLAAGFQSCSSQAPADLILTGGVIHTMDPDQTSAEAVAVRDGRIIFVGSRAGVKKFKASTTNVLDLTGLTVFPGLVDAHAHLIGLGRSLSELNFIGTGSVREVRDIVLAGQKSAPDNIWIKGRGWDQNDWEVKEFPHWRDLAGTEANPVYLKRVDGHAAWVNSTALVMCGITRDTPDPPGGKILRDNDGAPTGILIDDAMDLVSGTFANSTVEERLQWAEAAIEECHQYGLVGVHDAGTLARDLAVYNRLHFRGQLNFRVYGMVEGDSLEFLEERLRIGPASEAGGYVNIRSVKLYADGALGSRGAKLLAPYSDDPGNTGLFVQTPDSLYLLSRLALEAGFQVCTHAIGDAGNRVTLDAYEKALAELPTGDHRFRIEHAQIVALEDIPRFAQLQVIPSMQPTHATSDMYWAEDRVGQDRIKGAYAWRKFLDQDKRMPFGSDFPVEGVNPLWGIYAAVTRMDQKGWPAGGWHPEERCTIQEAVAGFTVQAAYASFDEDRSGSITAGKYADFTVLDRDLFKIPAEEILKTRVVHTIVGGRIVYTAPERSDS